MFFLAQKLSRNIGELLESMTDNELTMWQHYYSEPRDEKLLSLQTAQLTSVLANIYGAKTKMTDFMFDFSEQRKEKGDIQQRLDDAISAFATGVKNNSS